MLVYGDHDRVVYTRALLSDIRVSAAGLAAEPAGLTRHGALASLFLKLAGLLQGVADAEFAVRGADEASQAQDAIVAALIESAGCIDSSWRSGFASQMTPDLRALDALDEHALPARLSLRQPEGYAFYALYPELYLAAARDVPAGSLVIGLRSIGTGLAALVAAVCGGRAVTLRPVGPPFSRSMRMGPELTAAIGHTEGAIVLVDEGPGLSGSSLGGAADWLEEVGIADDRILFMPSHGGDLGPEASAAHRERWNASRRLHASFDEVIISPRTGLPLAEWFRDLTGEPLALEELSGGAWRARSPWGHVPADPAREARKFLLTASGGRFLLKFVGLDAAGQAKFGRARRLYEAGFSLEPLAYRYGFLLERWVESGVPNLSADVMTSHLTRYLRFRAAAFADAPPGASLERLMDMARYNVGQATDAGARSFAAWPAERLRRLQDRVRPVHVDGRLHRWEWLATNDGILKTDAVDHSHAHDLVGCQDIAWDVAGAAVEFDLPDAARDRMRREVVGEDPSAAELVACLTLCYLGFQIGWWTYAADEAARTQRQSYVAKAEGLADA